MAEGGSAKGNITGVKRDCCKREYYMVLQKGVRYRAKKGALSNSGLKDCGNAKSQAKQIACVS